MKKRLVALLTVVSVISCNLMGCGVSKNNSDIKNAPTVNEEESSESKDIDTKTDGVFVKNPTYEFHSTDTEFIARECEDQITYMDLHEQYGPIPDWEGNAYIHVTLRGMESEFFRVAQDGYNAFQEKMSSAGYNLIPIDFKAGVDQSDAEGQLAAMTDQVREGGNGILLYGVTDINCIPALEAAHDSGMPVYAINSEVPGCDGFIGPDGYKCGELAAEEMAKNINYQGDVAIVMGLTSQRAAIDRTQGFVDWMEQNAPNVEIVAKENGGWNRAKGHDVAKAILLQHPDIVGIYSNSDEMCYGVLQATEASGRVCGEDIFIVSIDGDKEALQMIKEGRMTATVSLSSYYMAQVAAEVCVRNMMGQKLPRVIWSPYGVWNADNIDKPESEVLGWTEPELK